MRQLLLKGGQDKNGIVEFAWLPLTLLFISIAAIRYPSFANGSYWPLVSMHFCVLSNGLNVLLVPPGARPKLHKHGLWCQNVAVHQASVLCIMLHG